MNSYSQRVSFSASEMTFPHDRMVLVFQGERLPLYYQKEDLLPVLECLQDWRFSINNLFQLLSFSG